MGTGLIQLLFWNERGRKNGVEGDHQQMLTIGREFSESEVCYLGEYPVET